MTNPLDPVDDDSTPLDDEEREGLLLSYITTRAELNEAELACILKAEEWAFSRKRGVLDQIFLDTLHKKMLGEVWRWAGEIRRTEKNIGIDAYQIRTEVKNLIDDCAFWIQNETYDYDEIATRFHHRLVYIHPYANGNGRHSRLAADLLLVSMGQERFSWGRENLVSASETRSRYITALRSADNHDYKDLLEFVRS